MADLATLKTRLNKLLHPSEISSDGWRILRPEADQTVETVLVAEISETALLRQLVFRNPRGEDITLVATSGRVLHIALPKPDGTLEPVALPRDPADLPGELAARVSTHLGAFLADSATLSLTSYLAEVTAVAAHLGLAPTALLSLSRKDATPTNIPFARFVAAAGPLVDATIIFDGTEKCYASGLDTAVAALEAQAREECTDPGDAQDQADTGEVSCAIYAGHPEEGISVFCAAQNGALLLTAFRYERLAAILAAWHAGQVLTDPPVQMRQGK